MQTQNISNRARKFKRKAFEVFTVLKPEMLGMQVEQKNNCAG
jgi:hypothetical protein